MKIHDLYRNINNEKLILIFLTSSILALSLAYVTQYIFGLQPCQLCLWQRKPFFVIIFLATILYIAKFLKKDLKKTASFLAWIMILLFLINAKIGLYHFGVENKWFEGLDSCAGGIESEIDNLEQLKLSLKKSGYVISCDKAEIKFLGLSMAGWNIFYNIFFAAFGIISKHTAARKIIPKLIFKKGKY